MNSAPILQVTDLAVHFPVMKGLLVSRQVGAVRAVDGVSFAIRAGETLGLVGESGSGKSTTGRAILRLIGLTGGRVEFEGVDVAGASGADDDLLRRRIQMIFQNPFASLNPRMTIGNIIADPLRVHRLGTEPEIRAKVQQVLDLVGLDPSLVNRYPHQFSGGQRQRIGVARALVVEPSLIICDEPVSALDVSIQAQILNLLDDVQVRLGPAYLLISHDLAVVRHIADQVAVMYLGRIVEVADRDTIYQDPRHPYTIALMDAVHVPDPRQARARAGSALSGEVPSPTEPPPGCHFHTRCPLRRQLGNPIDCETVDPVFRDLGHGHKVACHFADQSGPKPSLLTLPIAAKPAA